MCEGQGLWVLQFPGVGTLHYTKELALLLTTAVCEDGGPEAPDAEDNSCGKEHGAQVDESHYKGITETVVGQVHVRS